MTRGQCQPIEVSPFGPTTLGGRAIARTTRAARARIRTQGIRYFHWHTHIRSQEYLDATVAIAREYWPNTRQNDAGKAQFCAANRKVE